MLRYFKMYKILEKQTKNVHENVWWLGTEVYCDLKVFFSHFYCFSDIRLRAFVLKPFFLDCIYNIEAQLDWTLNLSEKVEFVDI